MRKTVDNHVDSVDMSNDENIFIFITIYVLRISSIYSACAIYAMARAVKNRRIARLFEESAVDTHMHATIAYAVLRMFMRT